MGQTSSIVWSERLCLLHGNSKKKEGKKERRERRVRPFSPILRTAEERRGPPACCVVMASSLELWSGLFPDGDEALGGGRERAEEGYEAGKSTRSMRNSRLLVRPDRPGAEPQVRRGPQGAAVSSSVCASRETALFLWGVSPGGGLSMTPRPLCRAWTGFDIFRTVSIGFLSNGWEDSDHLESRKGQRESRGQGGSGGGKLRAKSRGGRRGRRGDQRGLGLLRPARVLPGTVGLAAQPLL